MTVSELTMKGFVRVEMLHDTRRAAAELAMDVIYFLTPTPNAVEALKRDLSAMKNTVYIFLNAHSDVAGQIRALPHENIAGVYTVPIGVAVHEPRAYTTSPGPPSQHAMQLAALCNLISADGVPAVRYWKSSQGCAQLASELQGVLKSGRPGRTLVLIADRAWDLQTPLIHGTTYQSAVYDMLTVLPGGTVRIPGMGRLPPERLDLSEHDPTWVQMRHEPLVVVRDKLQNAMDAVSGGGRDTRMDFDLVTSLQPVVKTQPFVMKKLASIQAHLRLAQQCITACNKNWLGRVVTQEQRQAGGEARALDHLLALFADDALSISSDTALRLILSFCISNPSAAYGTRAELCRFAGLPPSALSVIESLTTFGVPLSPQRDCESLNSLVDRSLFEGTCLYDQLTPDSWTYKGTLARTVQAIHRAGSTQPLNDEWSTGPTRAVDQILVFVLGGITCEEIAVAHNLPSDVFVGGTDLLTPSAFLQSLHDVGS